MAAKDQVKQINKGNSPSGRHTKSPVEIQKSSPQGRHRKSPVEIKSVASLPISKLPHVLSIPKTLAVFKVIKLKASSLFIP